MVPEPHRSPVRSAGAVDGHVGEHLGRRPVHRAVRRARDDLAVEHHLDVDVEAGGPVDAQVVEHLRASWPGRSVQAASSAASGVTHALIEVANDLPRNGPSGTYSQAWMSRADQSLRPTTPKMWSAKSAVATALAQRRRDADHEAELGLDVEPRATGRRSARVARRAPCAARTGARRRCPRRRPCRSGRGSRRAGASSWAAAARRRAGTSGRRWRRGARRRRSRRSRRPRTAVSIVTESTGAQRRLDEVALGLVGQQPGDPGPRRRPHRRARPP